MSGIKRMTVYYYGRVQGVGFRATVMDIADDFQVVGLVRNLHDGSVRLDAEGVEEELERFRASIEERMQRNIESVRCQWGAAVGQWDGFRIGADAAE